MHWFDATRLPGWHYFKPTEEVDTTPRLQITRGVLVGAGLDAVAVAGTVSPQGLLDSDTGYADILIVPRGCVTSIEVIP